MTGFFICPASLRNQWRHAARPSFGRAALVQHGGNAVNQKADKVLRSRQFCSGPFRSFIVAKVDQFPTRVNPSVCEVQVKIALAAGMNTLTQATDLMAKLFAI
jgi:hypothetical protein